MRLGPRLRLLWWAVAGASLWLRSGIPIHAIGDAGLDDALFVRLARLLGAGLWLGPFDNTTLVKGMAFPFFILVSFVAGIPLKLAEQAVWLAAAAAGSLLVGRGGGGGRWLATALFAAVAFDPVLWTLELSRIIREGLYVGLSLAVVVAAVAVVVVRRPAGPTGLALGLAFGIIGGAFWLTREEGVWLLPAIALALLLGLAAPRSRHGGSALAGLSARCLPLAMACIGCAATIGTVVLLNQRIYGVAETVEVRSSAFEAAYGALSRIGQRQPRRFVVFPQDARALAYEVSPASRELAPTLDGPAGRAWIEIGCRAAPMPDCTEIQASWFQWALRDAVKDAGHYASAPEAARFYRQLADEIDGACDRHAIPCGPKRASLAPPFQWRYLRDALPVAARLLAALLRPGSGGIGGAPSEGPAIAIDLFAETAGPVARGLRPSLIVDALIGSRRGTATLTLGPLADATVHAETALGPAEPEAGGAEMPMRPVRFVTDCPPARCELFLQADDRLFSLGPLADLHDVAGDDFAVTGLHATAHVSGQAQQRRTALIAGIARRIAAAYDAITPVLAVTGVLGVVLAALVRRRQAFASPAFLLAAASVVAVASRVALLAYLDVTAIPSDNVLYPSPASPFVIVAAVLGSAVGASTLVRPAA